MAYFSQVLAAIMKSDLTDLYLVSSLLKSSCYISLGLGCKCILNLSALGSLRLLDTHTAQPSGTSLSEKLKDIKCFSWINTTVKNENPYVHTYFSEFLLRRK